MDNIANIIFKIEGNSEFSQSQIVKNTCHSVVAAGNPALVKFNECSISGKNNYFAIIEGSKVLTLSGRVYKDNTVSTACSSTVQNSITFLQTANIEVPSVLDWCPVILAISNECPGLIPNPTPFETVYITPFITPGKTFHATPARTNHQTPIKTNQYTPAITNHQTPVKTNHYTPAKTNHQTPVRTFAPTSVVSPTATFKLYRRENKRRNIPPY